MVVFPVVKLATLALRTACKPIANRLKKEAGYHLKFRNFIISIAQANHRLTTRVQRRIYGHATDVAIHPLNEEKAVQAAADLLGELFVFSTNVADAILIAVADILKTLMLQPKTRTHATKFSSVPSIKISAIIDFVLFRLQELPSSLRCKEVQDQKQEKKNYVDRRYRLSSCLCLSWIICFEGKLWVEAKLVFL
ncbi:optic atrophy 3 protein homolog isoform X1 [Glycine soja]|uniref:Optic atrophy 3 protein-like isoform A n=1 Tax=Glycine soja TaxID=3848 RepID=A0A445KG14_GLYSO|nr:optic atrophy 3 protein homolog isoform X1 [Glycine soja]RZC09573.1 Optic atrophy 3 protein-like isoform A [Glycine soja]